MSAASTERGEPRPWAVPTETLSGHPLDAAYGPAEAELPGAFPYTRGLHPEMYRTRPWTMRMFAGFGAPADTNARFHALLGAGQTGLSTAFDMPTLMGYDPDHERSRGEVGVEGVSAATIDDYLALFDGIDLGQVSVSMTISGPAPFAFALFVAAAERRGVDRARLAGTLQTDILKEYIAQREWIVPERPAMRLVGDLVAWCADETPRWHPLSVSGYHIREAGATAAQELAFTLADGIAYAQHLVDRGLDPDRFLPRFSFFFDCQVDLFEEVAKLRAARRLWAEEVRRRFAPGDPRSLQCRMHCQTAGVSLTAQAPLLNIARTTVEALAGILGGTQSLHTNGYDETYALPTLEAATLALRTQQMLAVESGAASVADPLGGSYLVERLTDEIAAAARAEIAEIDRRGGMVAAVEQGYPQAEIAESAYRHELALAAGERLVVGVNAFREQSAPEIPLHAADPRVEAAQVAAVRRVRAQRDPARHAHALGAVEEAFRGDANVMPHLVAAAHAGATIGELADAARAVFGVYTDPAIY